MAQTPLTGSSAYATNAQLLERYDVRTVADLLSDAGRRLSAGEVTNSTRLSALLQQVSGEIEAAAVAGRRYLPADLAALTGNAKEFLIGLVCDLVLLRLFSRRPGLYPVPTQCQRAELMLETLREGQRIFPTEESASAGMTVERVDETDTFLTECGRRYFGNLDCC